MTEILKNEPVAERVEAHHPIYHRLIHWSVWLYAPAMALCLGLPAYYCWLRGQLWPLLLLPLGLVAADFISGLAHWFFDNYGSPQTPVFGQTIELFRVHHDLPEDICLSSLEETIGHVCVWSGPMMLLHLPLLLWTDWPLAGCAWTLFFGSANVFLALTNLFHKWAHLAQAPKWIQSLQRAGLILNGEHHQVHHTPPFSTYYCITTGWCNPLLHRFGFFPGLEKSLYWLGIHKSSAQPQLGSLDL